MCQNIITTSLLAELFQDRVLLAVGRQVGLQLGFLLFQVDWQLVVHVVEYRQHRRVLVLVTLVQSISHSLASCRSFSCLIRNLGPDALQELGQSFDGLILVGPLSPFVWVSVQR